MIILKLKYRSKKINLELIPKKKLSFQYKLIY